MNTLNYGMKAKKLASDLDIEIEEAEGLIEKYMGRYPGVQSFYDSAIESATKTGYAFTIMGRRRFLPDLVSPKQYERFRAQRQACNFEIQGTAADVVRMAMIAIYEHGLDKRFDCKMLLQVHDELVFSCPEETMAEADKIIRECMEHSLPGDLAVPLEVSGNSGFTWAEAK